MADVTMPRLSDTMEEGTIASWLKKPGEKVDRGEVIAQIETDKATMDLTAFEAGTLQEILAPEGSTVAIGQPVARIGNGKAAPAVAAPAKAAPAAEKAASPAEKPAPAAEAATPEPANVAPPPLQTDGKTRASPMARHIAAEHDLDLSHIQGSGPQGRVIRADVEAAVKSSTPDSPQSSVLSPQLPTTTSASACPRCGGRSPGAWPKALGPSPTSS